VCALLKNGTAECWGSNNNGELGTGTTNASLTPVKVKGLSTVTALSAGGVNGNYTCALLQAGTVKCWGYNGEGELGNGTTRAALTPVSVAGLGGAISITTGGRHACAEMKNAVVKCWGENSYGELGNGTTKDATRPTVVVFL
jgi:alpha-tubulin suppressor-like RCC1 family protein